MEINNIQFFFLKALFFFGNLIFRRPYETKFKRKVFKYFFDTRIKYESLRENKNTNILNNLNNKGYFQLKKDALTKLTDHDQIINICNKIISNEANYLKTQKSYLKTLDFSKVEKNY